MHLAKKYFTKYLRKLSLVDIVFVSVIFLLIMAFYLFFKRDVVFITVRLKVTDENPLYAISSPPNEYAESFIKGDREFDELGRPVAEIVNVDTYKTRPDQQVTYVTIKLKAVYNPRKQQYSVRGKNIAFGESFIFSFTKIRFRALVVDFPGFSDTTRIRPKIILVRAQLRDDKGRSYSDVYGVPDYIANAVKINDEVTSLSNHKLVRIIDITKEPAKRLTVGTNGQATIIEDPYLVDVFYTIEIYGTEVNGKDYMFDYNPILIGFPIPINLKTVSIWPTITEIVKSKPYQPEE